MTKDILALPEYDSDDVVNAELIYKHPVFGTQPLYFEQMAQIHLPISEKATAQGDIQDRRETT